MFSNKLGWIFKGSKGNYLVKGNKKVHNWQVRNMPNQKQYFFGNEVLLLFLMLGLILNTKLIRYHSYLKTRGLMNPIDDNDLLNPKFLPTNITTSCQCI